MACLKVAQFIIGILFLALYIHAADDASAFKCKDLYEYDATTPGTISSPFYGEREEYPDSIKCIHKITAPGGYRIKITFKDFHVQLSSGCVRDFLAVLSKNRKVILAAFCGFDVPNPILSKEGENEIYLIFQTDFFQGARGFLVEYESSPYFNTVCETGWNQCTNRNCYKPEQKCDGADDCGDGTDEEDCGQPIDLRPKICGKPEIPPNTKFLSSDRMVGGEVVVPHSWPWQVSLQNTWKEPNGHFCGGTLINAQWVLTASHCVKTNRFPGQIRLHFGAHYKYNKTQYQQVRISSKIISFPGLEGDEILKFDITHDISLIKLNAPIKFNKGVQPACLPFKGRKPPAGSTCYATGWGETRGTGGSDELKQSEQIVRTANECKFNKFSQICVEQRNKSPCHGDSGGPLNCKVNDKWIVYGAASYVNPTNYIGGICTGPAAKTVYACTDDKADWIKTTINKYS